jgi:site-specific DNA-methyltransferase (adenine-specific)
LPSDSIDLIYCDILYGTGKDFIYFKDISSVQEIVYKFYEDRIIEMLRVLKSTGSIYLQMDTNIIHWIRSIMDSIFGYKNFVNEIIWWNKKFSQNNDRSFIRNHDNILIYGKTSDYKFKPQYITSLQKKTRIKKGYYNAGNCILVYDMEKYKNSNVNKDSNIKLRLNEKPLIKCDDVIFDINFINSQSKERVDYPTQKPLQLMERFIKASSDEGDLVADFFMGSGSFLVKAKELNRNFIGCDISQYAVDLTNKRLGDIEL